MFNTEDFKNDYYNYLSIDEMKLKYGICNTTYFTILKKLGIKRPIATKINKLMHINKDKQIESKIENVLDKPKESKIERTLDKPKTTNNNITSFGNVEILCNKEDNIKPVYHKQITESNIEVIKKPTIKIDRHNKEKNDILDDLLNSVNDTINNANKKKKKNKIINNK